MSVYLHRVATAVPSATYTQDQARDVMKAWIGGERRTDLLLGRVYANSGIEQRHSVVGDFLPPEEVRRDADPNAEGSIRLAPQHQGGGFFRDEAGVFRNPGTAERNARYRDEAGALFVAAGQAVLDQAEGFSKEDVTHVITVSCTGFYAPGPDLDVVHGLGLAPTTERYHVGFMGCYAAFPALRMANAFCRANPDAVVLIVIVELCSLHLQDSREVDAVVAASVFADGAVGAIVSSREPTGPALALERFVDGLAPEGAGDMAWTIGDHGFDMVLSSYVPKIVGEKAHFALTPLLEGTGVNLEDVRRWAVHPGGRAILDKLAQGLALPEEALTSSRRVLATYGNMSAATVMFVLADMMREPAPPGEPVIAMAFGPGLTVASGLLRTT